MKMVSKWDRISKCAVYLIQLCSDNQTTFQKLWRIFFLFARPCTLENDRERETVGVSVPNIEHIGNTRRYNPRHVRNGVDIKITSRAHHGTPLSLSFSRAQLRS